MHKTNIVLIGMPATGKSTLGRLLAEAINKRFIDTDELISKTVGMSCQEAIDTYSLERFSDLENDALLSIDQHNLVISTGGSAVYCREGIQFLRKNALVLHLSASLKTLEERISDFETRAIIISDNMTFSDLYNERMPLYKEIADIELKTDHDGDTPEKSVSKALEAINAYMA